MTDDTKADRLLSENAVRGCVPEEKDCADFMEKPDDRWFYASGYNACAARTIEAIKALSSVEPVLRNVIDDLEKIFEIRKAAKQDILRAVKYAIDSLFVNNRTRRLTVGVVIEHVCRVVRALAGTTIETREEIEAAVYKKYVTDGFNNGYAMIKEARLEALERCAHVSFTDEEIDKLTSVNEAQDNDG